MAVRTKEPRAKSNPSSRSVCLSYWPERIGIVTRAGLEVSEVKFEDGTSANYINEYLIPVEEKTNASVQRVLQQKRRKHR
jgi:hypothetical protein